MAHDTKVTSDHSIIRNWVEKREGKPATVKKTGDKTDAGVLRISFPGYAKEDSLQAISWDEFFKKFEEKELAFLYQEQTRAGQESRFFRFVRRGSRG